MTTHTFEDDHTQDPFADDDGDKDRNAVRWSIAFFAILTVFIVGSALFIGAHMAGAISGSGLAAETGQRSDVRGGGAPPFQLAGVPLGLTPAEANALVPSLVLSQGDGLEMLADFTIGNGDYRLSFHGPDGGTKAYRMRYRETFAGLSGSDVEGHLTRKFGRPKANRCEPVGRFGVWTCRLRWLRPDGVEITAVTQTHMPDGLVASTSMTLSAIDPRLPSGKTITLGAANGRTGPPVSARFEAIAAGLRGRW